MHHIYTRRLIPRELLNQVPLPFHILLCPECHNKPVDNSRARAEMMVLNVSVYGWEAVEQAFTDLNDLLPSGIKSFHLDIEEVKELWSIQMKS
jgi:hypothetical protein